MQGLLLLTATSLLVVRSFITLKCVELGLFLTLAFLVPFALIAGVGMVINALAAAHASRSTFIALGITVAITVNVALWLLSGMGPASPTSGTVEAYGCHDGVPNWWPDFIPAHFSF